MGTEIATIFDKEQADPAFLDQGDIGGLDDGIGASYARLTYRGKVWALTYRGERYEHLREDGDPVGFIDLVVLRDPGVKSKSYYPKKAGTDYETSQERPLCASIDGQTPDPDVTEPQAEACRICPRNEWKNNPETGKKTRECNDYKRLAVMLTPEVTKKLLGFELMEPVFLRIPPASLDSLAKMGAEMKRRGYPYNSFVTRVRFAKTPHPQLEFSAVAKLTKAEFPVINEMRMDALSLRITGEDVIGMPRSNVVHLEDKRGSFVPAKQVEKPAAEEAKMVEAEATVGSFTSRNAPAANTKPRTVAPAPKEKLKEVTLEAKPNGKGAFSVPPDEEDTKPLKSTAQTADDTGDGEPTEADADLDAQIKALMNAS